MSVVMVSALPSFFIFASIVMMLSDSGLALADSERLIDPRLGRDGALCRIGYGLPHELNGIDRKIVWFHDHRGAVVLTQAGDKSGLARLALIRRKQIQFGNEYAIRKCDLPHGYGMVGQGPIGVACISGIDGGSE